MSKLYLICIIIWLCRDPQQVSSVLLAKTKKYAGVHSLEKTGSYHRKRSYLLISVIIPELEESQWCDGCYNNTGTNNRVGVDGHKLAPPEKNRIWLKKGNICVLISFTTERTFPNFLWLSCWLFSVLPFFYL